MLNFLFLLISNIYCLSISNIEKNGDFFVLEFSKVFKISDIKYNKKYDNFELSYEKFNEKKFKNIYVFSKKMYIEIKKAISTNNTDFKNDYTRPQYEIFDFKNLKSPSRIANIVISFDKDINVVFGIVKKNNFYIIYPPKNFIFIDNDYKKNVYRYILNYIKK